MSEAGSQSLPDEALVDLLVKQVTEGLSSAEQLALDAMDSATVAAELKEFERAAAAVALAGTPLVEPPAALRKLLEQRGARLFDSAKVVELPPRPAAIAVSSAPVSRYGSWGWFAAAACLVLAVVAWNRAPQAPAPSVAQAPVPVQVPVPVQPPPAPVEMAPPSPADARLAMLSSANSVKVVLMATKDPAAAGVTGDVVWDPNTQKGFLHFVGLASNDPQGRQYQIWVFDGKRDKRYPVDGGVFDVPADASEVVIPIHAALPIGLAKAFAVTVEKPGGVVVSALGHVVALGTAG